MDEPSLNRGGPWRRRLFSAWKDGAWKAPERWLGGGLGGAFPLFRTCRSGG
nr:MAG TPA: hypothetical protein [Caudoviricetes sp.]